MRTVGTTARRGSGIGLVLGLLLLGVPSPSHAVLEQPDAMFYGHVFDTGKPAASGVVVQVRSGQTVLDSFTIGADSFYAVRIPIAQATVDGETLGGTTVYHLVCSGGQNDKQSCMRNDDCRPQGAPGGDCIASTVTVGLFVGYHSAGEVAVHSGKITQRDLTAGVSLCSGGSKDGQACMMDSDCPGGLCVVAQALCDGGSEDGMRCQCIGSTCGTQPACAENSAMGTCSGGALAGECCDLGMNCADGAACAGSARICAGGNRKGFPCLRDAHCPGSTCASPGKVCNGGTLAGQSCVDDADCGGGMCGARVATPTPTRTPTRTRTAGGTGGTPTPTQTPGGCAGDCNGSGDVTINELISMVNVALGNSQVSACTAGDVNHDETITINEIISAVAKALNGCTGG